MKYLMSLFFITLLNVNLFAQAPDTVWTRTFGSDNIHDSGNSVQQTLDGGYIIAGYKGNNVWLIKTDANGDTIWTNTFEDGTANCVQQTSDGGYIIVGYSDDPDVMLVKTNMNGDTLWTRTYGDTLGDYGNSVRQTSDGGFIIVGSYSKSFMGSSGDVVLIKTDCNGDTIWTKIFGDSLNHSGNSVQQTSDSGYIVVGTYNEPVSLYSLPPDVWLIKTDSNGDTLWSQIIRGSEDLGYQSSSDVGNSVQQTLDGGYVITGVKDNDIWLIKTNVTGDTVWTRTFEDGKGNSVQQTSDGGYIIVGSKNDNVVNVWLIKTNGNGVIEWNKILNNGYAGWGNSVRQTSDGGYIIAGVTTTLNDFKDVWLIKIASDATSIDEQLHTLIKGFKLKQNYPNPFNHATVINYRLAMKSVIQLIIYDINGRKIKTLINQTQNSGEHSISFNASGLASGIYVYKLKTDSFVQSRKMLLLR